MNHISDVVAHEYLFDYGFCREKINNVNNSGGGLLVGSVICRSKNGSKWYEVTAESMESWMTVDCLDFAIVIDMDIGCSSSENVMCITQGPAIIKRGGLFYNGKVTPEATDFLVNAIESRMTLVNVD